MDCVLRLVKAPSFRLIFDTKVFTKEMLMRMRHSAIAIALLLTSFRISHAEYIPISLAPIANQTPYWIVDPPSGLTTLGGVPFDIPTSGNNTWDASIGTTIGVRSTTAMELPMNVYGATAVHTLINLGWGVLGSRTVTATFIGTGGANYSVELETGSDIRNWLNTPFCCNTINGTSTIQIWEGEPAAFPGYVAKLDKQRIELPASFATETLTKFILVDSGISGDITNTIYDNSETQRAFIYGVTVETVPEPSTIVLLVCCLCPIVWNRYRSER